MIQFTSALAREQNSELLSILKGKIYSLIVLSGEEGITNKEIASKLQVDASTVSGCVRPLVKEELVKEGAKRYCKTTGNLAIAWKENIKGTLF